ncbi:MAG: Gfo/Idh/MocA family oxidoreductase [Lentisphaeria bacterium]|nr:Gfo/Idh/MocA family oxidoreductase [Lentisphaeria bacterium]
MTVSSGKRVAVLGASGIGKHHANWWTVEGAEVCAILGSSEESVATTGENLREMFDFGGRCYTDLDQLLLTEKPDIVDVCTPPEMHFAHALTALHEGSDVLCEKPFVYDCTLTSEIMLEQARDLINIAVEEKRQFGVCTQYTIAAKTCLELYTKHSPGERIDTFSGILKSPTRGRSPDPTRTWVDLAPHMLSALSVIAPSGRIAMDSMKADFSGHQAQAEFLIVRAEGSILHCDILTDHTDDEPANVRQFVFNDCVFDIAGGRGKDGHFHADIKSKAGNMVCDDAMRVLIRRFLAGDVAVTGAAALLNMRRMLGTILKVEQS